MCRTGGPYCYERNAKPERLKALYQRRIKRGGNKISRLKDKNDPKHDDARNELFATAQEMLGNFDESASLDDLAVMVAEGGAGGFTFSTEKKTTPLTGFIVSPYPKRSKMIPAGQPVRASDIKGYMDDNADLLSDEKNHLGGWRDPETGNVFLDVSIRVEDAKEARQLCLENDQIAFYDAQCGKEVDVNRDATSGQESLKKE